MSLLDKIRDQLTEKTNKSINSDIPYTETETKQELDNDITTSYTTNTINQANVRFVKEYGTGWTIFETPLSTKQRRYILDCVTNTSVDLSDADKERLLSGYSLKIQTIEKYHFTFVYATEDNTFVFPFNDNFFESLTYKEEGHQGKQCIICMNGFPEYNQRHVTVYESDDPNNRDEISDNIKYSFSLCELCYDELHDELFSENSDFEQKLLAKTI